ncbi:hypothetical protein [Phenylobacterium sp. J367]|uniref:hypothetical protein n=1 Tax=Phenylobacterium sp. J367 TaxID=2898435 RepID=UPI002151C653|nr:hypothetical protein [Phenylobacterium sp. J367]MCR5879401.1 hypothetical protein [Phenylobacterium sp. J367]
MSPAQDAAAVVAGALAKRRPKERAKFLRELLAHTAAGLVVIEGDRAAGGGGLSPGRRRRRPRRALIRHPDERVSMGRPFDPARETRARLQVLEARERARTEARAVAEGVAETVGLSQARGAAFTKDAQSKARATPYRRQAGLAWLLRKGRITPRQAKAGELYGEAFRRAAATPHIGSTLEVQPGPGLKAGPPLAVLVRMARGRREAEATLGGYRRRLFEQSDLVAACDLVCGQELTPREAAGCDRDAARMEAVLKVALDILAAR